MKIKINSKIHLEGLSDQDAETIRQRFTFPNPDHRKALRLGKSVWKIPRFLCLAHHEQTGTISLPRGTVPDVIRINPEAEIIDATVSVPVDFPPFLGKLRDYQTAALKAMASKRQGLLQAGCGSGKTVIGIALIQRHRQRSIILVHTRDLLHQWEERIREYLGIWPGIIGGGQWEEGDRITLATVQSLNRPLDENFLRGYGLILQDECHHTPAWTFRKVIDQFPSRYRYGLTATPERADGFTFLLSAVIGNTLHQVKEDDLSRAGCLLTPSIRVIETDSSLFDIEEYGHILQTVCSDQKRNRLILEIVTKEARSGHSCLVLSERVEHCRQLNQLFQETGIPSATISGQDSERHRQTVLNDVSDRKTLVLFASKIADEGLDLPVLSRLFLATPKRSAGRITQQIGRIRRPFPGKPGPVVFDFLDVNSGLCISQYRTRKNQAYRGFPIEICKTENCNDRNFSDCQELPGCGAFPSPDTGRRIEGAFNPFMA